MCCFCRTGFMQGCRPNAASDQGRQPVHCSFCAARAKKGSGRAAGAVIAGSGNTAEPTVGIVWRSGPRRSGRQFAVTARLPVRRSRGSGAIPAMLSCGANSSTTYTRSMMNWIWQGQRQGSSQPRPTGGRQDAAVTGGRSIRVPSGAADRTSG